MKLYHYPKCSTCRKAIKFLAESGREVELVDISQSPPSAAELNQMLASNEGDRRKLFNTSGMQYRELQLKDKLPQMSDAEAIQLLSGNGMLVKRPFMLDGSGRGLVGFKEDQWESFFK